MFLHLLIAYIANPKFMMYMHKLVILCAYSKSESAILNKMISNTHTIADVAAHPIALFIISFFMYRIRKKQYAIRVNSNNEFTIMLSIINPPFLLQLCFGYYMLN